MVQDRQSLRHRLAAVAATQGGLFTARQAIDVGYSYQAQKFHVDRGNWLRVDRGIFRLPEWPVSEQESLIQWSLWSRGLGVVSHESALAVHGLGVANPEKAHLTVPATFRQQNDHVVLHRGLLTEGDIRHYEGFRITTPLRTVLDAAASQLDLDDLIAAIADASEADPTVVEVLLQRQEELGDHTALRLERALRICGLL